MKIFLMFFLFLMLGQNCRAIDENFLDEVLSDSRRNSYFISLKIVVNKQSKNVIIENDDLFYYLFKTKEFNEKEYRLFLKKLIMNDSKLSVKESEIEKWNFTIVSNVKSVSDLASKGQNEFISHYFDGQVLKDNLSENEKNAVIEQLFKWNIATNIDDETGYLVLKKLSSKIE
jgi:hypothetical protein